MNKIINWENLSKLNKPYIHKLHKELNKLDKSGMYIMGKNVKKFEEACCSYFKCKYAVACGNALDGLTLCLKSFEFPSDSEVIIPSNTFYATALAVLRNNLKPIICEPDLNTYNITSEEIESKITKKTKAIICVHLYGKPCEMNKIIKIARKYGLKIIEDCAQAFGAEYKGKKVGNLSDAGVFSFYPTKNLGGIGDGGIIITNNEKLYKYVAMARNYGGLNYKYEISGINSRMDEIQAMFLLSKLKDIEKINEKKIENANLYLKYIKNENIILPIKSNNEKNVFYIFPIRCKKRDNLKKYLEDNGIITLIHYPVPLTKQPIMNINKKYPITEEISGTILSLPCSATHNIKEIKYIIKKINEFKD